MAKHLAFPTRAKSKPRRAPFSAGTFIQRSRAESSEQKAIWHNVTGAGRSHVRREFFGLTDREQETAREKLEGLIARRLQGVGR